MRAMMALQLSWRPEFSVLRFIIIQLLSYTSVISYSSIPRKRNDIAACQTKFAYCSAQN